MSSALLKRISQIAAKAEAAEGTAESLTATEAKVLVYGPKFETDFDQFDRDPARATLSHLASLVGKQAGSASFRAELRGSGAVATAPSWDTVLQGCGFQKSTVSNIAIGAVTSGPFVPAETITGGTSAATGRVVGEVSATPINFVVLTGTFQSGEVITGGTSGATATSSGAPAANKGFEWRPLSVAPPSLTIARYLNGTRQLLYGARGNLKITAEVGQPAFMDFNYLGVYDATTDTAILAPTYETTIPPVFMNVGFSVQALAAVFSKFSLDMKNTLTPRESANATKGALSVFIGNRNPNASVDPEMTLVADHDFFGKLASGATGRAAFKLGTTAGNTIWVAMPLTQYEKVGDGDRGGIYTADIDLGLKSASVNTGDDEVIIAMV